MVSKRRVDMCFYCRVVPIQSDVPGDFCTECFKKNAAERERAETEHRLVKALEAQLEFENHQSAAATINELIKHHVEHSK